MEGTKRELERKPITSTLRNMKVGEVEEFSILQRISINMTICERLTREREAGSKWSYKTYRDEGVVKVTRIA